MQNFCTNQNKKFNNKQNCNETAVQCLQCEKLQSHRNDTTDKMSHHQNIPHSKYLTVKLFHSKN